MTKIHIAARRTWMGGSRGGLERAATRHIQSLVAQGAHVCLHTPRAESDVTWQPVAWPEWGNSRATFSAAYVIWIRRLAASFNRCWTRGDVAHFHGASGGALRWLNEEIARHSVVNPHGMEEFNSADILRNLSRSPIKFLNRTGSRRAAKLIATDRAMVGAVASNFGVDPGRIEVIENGIDTDGLEKVALTGIATCHDTSLVTVGRAVPNKGYDLLADALQLHFVRGGEPIDWHHYGVGPVLAELKAKTLEHATNFTAHERASDEEVQASVRQARLFVQPSRYEGSSLTVLEAMAQKTPVVATPVGGIPDKIIDGQTGILCEEASPDSICRAVGRALCSPRSRLVGAAYDHVRAIFSEDAACRKYVDLYASLAGIN